jgi:hypothetical protein
MFYDTSGLPMVKSISSNLRYDAFKTLDKDKRLQMMLALIELEPAKRNKFLSESFRGIAIKSHPLFEEIIFEAERKNSKYFVNLANVLKIDSPIKSSTITRVSAYTMNLNFLDNDYAMYRDLSLSLSQSTADVFVQDMNLIANGIYNKEKIDPNQLLDDEKNTIY